jgi:hypothetical protein
VTQPKARSLKIVDDQLSQPFIVFDEEKVLHHNRLQCGQWAEAER